MKRISAVCAGSLVFMSGLVAGQPAAAPPAAAPVVSKEKVAEGVTERWYVFLMQGQRAGWMRSEETREGANLRSASEMRLEIKRGPITIKVTMKTEFVETPDGKPVRMVSEQVLGAMGTKTTTTFNGAETEVVSESGGQRTVSKGKTPAGEWLTPLAAERFVKQELGKGAREIIFSTIDPTVGEGLVKVTRTIVGRREIDVFGRTVPAVEWESSLDRYPGVKSSEFVDPDGETLKSVTNMGGITLEQLAADKDLALSKLDAPELLESTVVKPNRTIDNPRDLKNATYRVSVADGSMPDLPTTAGQVFTREGERAGSLRQSAAGVEVVAVEKVAEVRAQHLTPSATLKSDDPEIIALVAKAKVEGKPPSEAAETLRRFVLRYINKKDMSVGFATASEVARTKTGDCTEHAVLLGAMLRAAGIPSRCASGLVYVEEFGGQEGIFGYHMWTQALLPQADGSQVWVNLDATLPEKTPYDAAHVLLSTSGLGEGEMQNFLVTTAPLIGRLRIEVVELR